MSPSPQVSGRISPRIHPGNPITPVHSPHHSVTSSVSSRTPIHTLTIHEYRRQQNTPVSERGTPQGKTLRRKTATPALGENERVSSVLQSRPRLDSCSSLHPLHFSQSAQQLYLDTSPAQKQALPDFVFRSQSAEPHVQTGSISSISTSNSAKVRNFGTRKRLPRPPVATGPVLSPLLSAHAKSPNLRRSALSTTFSCSTENLHPSQQTTPTPSTFSFSRFPQPPYHTDLSPSPPHDNRDDHRVNTLSFPTTAPVTPPTTPAIIHYRGASFDLVNPHDSLLFHNIVTPSRDFDSSDYLPMRSSEASFAVSGEMAPRRALYNNYNSAHANILRRGEEGAGAPNFDLPLPPTPAAMSPGSSSYTSPFYSPESINAPSPLNIKKSPVESRFSIKQLTRSLSRKLGKNPVVDYGEELQEMRAGNVSFASIDMEGEYPRPLDRTYIASPQASYFPLSPVSPVTPNNSRFSEGFGVLPLEDDEDDMPHSHKGGRIDTEPLSSLLPDDPSTQMGRMGNAQSVRAPEEISSKPYYDDINSIYASSSIYTNDDQRKSSYQHTSSHGRQSNLFSRISAVDQNALASQYNQDSLYEYSGQTSRAITDSSLHLSSATKTDTISKLIDEYNPDGSKRSSTAPHLERVETGNEREGLIDMRTIQVLAGATRATSGLSQSDFDVNSEAAHTYEDTSVKIADEIQGHRPTNLRTAGPPPREAAPLAPAFEYDEAPFVLPRLDTSGMFSNDSSYSYGDTQNLLRIQHSDAHLPPTPFMHLQPSSSYSEPEVKAPEPSSSYSQVDPSPSPHTPQEALEQAEQIFETARTKKQERDRDIPAIWAGRNSGSQLFSKKLSDRSSPTPDVRESLALSEFSAVNSDKADWETIGRPSADRRESFDSIADYSSSEGTRNSLGLNSDGSLPSWVKQQHSRGLSHYGHPSPLRSHSHPFGSPPPDLRHCAGVRTAPEVSSSPLPSSPPQSATSPNFRFSAHPRAEPGRALMIEPYSFSPWAGPYALSDKETQELLASGPNDKIIMDDEPQSPSERGYDDRGQRIYRSSSSPRNPFGSPASLERVNTFDKLSVVGPKGNLTGTPGGTGMHEAGSSIANTSSPGVRLSSSVGRQSVRSGYPGFYATPFQATASVTRIENNRIFQQVEHQRSLSQETLFPGATDLEPVTETSPLPGGRHRKSLRFSNNFKSARRTSRSAVAGQTKLRQMVLAPDGRATMSSQDTHFSKCLNGSERPSTADTSTPLRPTHPSIDIFPLSPRTIVAHQHSPHLLCPERAIVPEDEAQRKKLSWVILAAFCLLPPCIILYRIWGDSIIASLTDGKLGHCTPQSKKAALIAGIAINVGIITAIVVPIAVLHALKAL
ncbi:hypothetical protein ACN47E_005488 [Coniothyrium glycines]